uniref:G-protein coupled receptors family 1 profile domain-containing protein n=1 Tax=Biomphalaria glabrata TaxID=6526 RepID=A0A2C9L5F3_BIOGL
MTSNNKTGEDSDMWVIDAVTTKLFVIVTCCVVCASVAFFGIILNLLNVCLFVKMGFQETANISLLGLSISDLCGLLTLEWMFLCLNPLFIEAGLPLAQVEVEYITGGYPHVCFARITGVITAFVTFERCLCIARPLDVKSFLTPSRTVLIIAGIYICMIASVVPAFEVNQLQWKFYASENRTKLGIAYNARRDEVEGVVLVVNDSFGYIAFVMVSVLTAILISSLEANRKWRLKSISTAHATTVTLRDKRMMRIVLVISTMFVTLSFPITVVFIFTKAYPQFGTWGKYSNLFYICSVCLTLLEICNSSFTFFVYYSMSAKFRQASVRYLTLYSKIRDKKNF